MTLNPSSQHAHETPLLYTVEETAALLKIGRDKVYELCSKGSLPTVILGERLIRIPAHLLRQWIDEQAKGGGVQS